MVIILIVAATCNQLFMVQGLYKVQSSIAILINYGIFKIYEI